MDKCILDQFVLGKTWSKELMCEFSGWDVFDNESLILRTPENNYCDMDGAINMAKRIFPNVSHIATKVGGIVDTCYRKNSLGEWECF